MHVSSDFNFPCMKCIVVGTLALNNVACICKVPRFGVLQSDLPQVRVTTKHSVHAIRPHYESSIFSFCKRTISRKLTSIFGDEKINFYTHAITVSGRAIHSESEHKEKII